jgi:outer membrane protein OmpU
MKNKLLLSTAIASVAFAGFASAETKVGGNLEQTFNALSSDTAQDSGRSFGAEHNISLSSSKDLDNGLTAKYGFTLEADDGASADSHYLTVGTDTVNVSFNRDAGINISGTAIPFIGDQTSTSAGTGLSGFLNTNINDSDVHDNDSVQLNLNAAGGTFSLQYAPSAKFGAAPDRADDSNNNGSDTNNSAMGLIYSGSLGVDGLKVLAGKTTQDGEGTAQDISETQYGAAYTFGQITVGAEITKMEETSAASDKKQTKFGVAFAANDNFSIGLYHDKAELENDATKDDEKVKQVQVGYNLGGLGFTVSYADIENVAGTANADAEQLQIRTIQKF